ncbi:hypothetical protein AB5J62_28785 [Amycolatopsis sp. cg5]|uniref:hypothetical protein n=1 Tax=Amycolatopsis sp. cg5 TaxID=3238802 RepID=UPI0035266290
MKLFGRRAAKPEPDRRTLITGHCYDDLALDAAIAELRDGDLRAAQTVLAECRDDPEVRDLRLSNLSEDLVGHVDEIAELAARHDDPELWLLAGEGFVAEAGAIRGAGWASSVGEDRFKMVHRTCAKAIGPLHRAAELLPSDPTPLVALMAAGMLLNASREQQDQVWEEVLRRCPTHYSAHCSRLQILAPKWGGTEEEMMTFAIETARTAPVGDALTAIFPAACFEVYLMAKSRVDSSQWREMERAYFANERILTLLLAASDRWMSAERPHPRAMHAHNHFAAAFGCAGHSERAFLHLFGTRDRFAPTRGPT